MRPPLDLRRWGHALVAFAAVAAVWPTMADVFLYDDAPVVRDNPLLAHPHLGAFFGGNVFGDVHGDLLFRPLLLVSLALDRALLGNHALGLHAVNVAEHALASLLVYRVLLALVDDPRRALAAALLFAVHPVHLDAVGFIVNRSEVLALIFIALGLLLLVRDGAWRAYLRDEDPPPAPGRRWPVAAAALALGCALLCKETAGGALAVAFVLAAVRTARRRRLPPPRVLVGLGLFVATFAVYLVARRLALGALTTSHATAWIQDRRAAVLFPTASRIYADYLRLVLVPYPLHFDYSNFVVSGGPLEPRALGSYAVHAVVLALALVLLRRGNSGAALCILGFYAALLPVSHVLPFREIEAERFLYIPSALACGLVACWAPRRATWLLVPLYGLVCLAEATHFRSAEALWSTMAARDPSNPRAQYNLGTALFEAQRCDLALPHLEAAVRLAPTYPRAWANLGECRVAVGDEAGARAALETAAHLDDDNPRAHRNLAVFRALHGDAAGARRELERARSLEPDAPQNARVEALIDEHARH
jgi:protein O-mannosyl-transferase